MASYRENVDVAVPTSCLAPFRHILNDFDDLYPRVEVGRSFSPRNDLSENDQKISV